jgi:hypothetical protein
MQHYGSSESVRLMTGTTFDALGLRGDGELDAFIETALERASAYIDADRGKSFADAQEAYRLVADDIAERIAANMIRAAERSRNKSLVTPEGGAEMQTIAEQVVIFTPSILADIKRLPRAAVYHFSTTDSRSDTEA